MRTCLGFPSYTPFAAWTGSGFDPNYPPSNLNDLTRLRDVALASGGGAVEADFLLPAAQPIQLVSLVNHNLSSYRVRLYSDNLTTLVYDSGAVSTQTPVANFSPTEPVLLTSPVSTLSGRITLTPSSGSACVSAIDLSSALLLTEVKSDQSRGFNSQSQRIKLPGGGYAGLGQWCPRVFKGSQEAQDSSLLTTSLLDLKSLGFSRPFLFVRDIDDPTSWPREAFVATHKSIPNSVTDGPFSGADSFDFEEFLG